MNCLFPLHCLSVPFSRISYTFLLPVFVCKFNCYNTLLKSTFEPCKKAKQNKKNWSNNYHINKPKKCFAQCGKRMKKMLQNWTVKVMELTKKQKSKAKTTFDIEFRIDELIGIELSRFVMTPTETSHIAMCICSHGRSLSDEEKPHLTESEVTLWLSSFLSTNQTTNQREFLQ